MVMLNSIEDTLCLVPFGFLVSLNCLDHFPVDPAISPVRATGQHLVTLCRSICAGARAQFLDLLMGSKYFTTYFITFLAFFFSLYCPFHRTLQVLIQMLLTQVKRALTSQRQVIPVVVCGRGAHRR